MRKIVVGGVMMFLLLSSSTLFAANLPVTSPFGWRIHPITGDWRFHTGVDLGYEIGTTIAALYAGEVVQAGDFGDGYGNQVLLYHPEYDCYTRYAHMDSIYVGTAQYVDIGTIIGTVGATGNVTGAHLHLELIVRGSDGAYTYVDPLSLWE